MIVVFSGTGNTLRCARMLAERLGEEMHILSSDELRQPQKSTLATDGRRVIWAFPTYSWGVPPVMADYIRSFVADTSVAEAEHFMLTTCGDDIGYTDRQWRRLMTDRGFRARGAYAVMMPNTYVLMSGFNVDAPEVAQAKLDAAPAEMESIAHAIEQGGADRLIRGAFPWIKTRIIYPWFVRYAMSARPFRHTDACTACGTCIRTCPMANISAAADGTPRWGDKCALCLRCYHICPQRAVAYGKKTDGKGQKQVFLK